MRRTVIAGLRAHKLRLLLTAFAIVLGVAFSSGTLITGDTIEAAFFDSFARSAKGVDVVVSPPERTADREPGDEPARVPFEVLSTVDEVVGVAEASGRLVESLPLLDRHGRVLSNFGQTGLGIDVPETASLRAFTRTDGRLPQRAGEAVIDVDTAARTGYWLGDRITVLGAPATGDAEPARHQLTVVGTIDLGANPAYADMSVVGMPADELKRLTHASGYAEVVAVARPGVSPEALAGQVRDAVGGDSYRVVTGAEARTALAEQAVSYVDPFLLMILAFAAISLVVAAFVIYNTFTILVAQRMRELALLRCVGASRRQVFGAVLAESTVVGVLASVVGLGVGVGMGYAIFAVMRSAGMPLPDGNLVIQPSTVVIALVLGVAVTVASAVLPARGATRVAPIAALRTQPQGRVTSRWRLVLRVAFALVLGGAGAAISFLAIPHGADGLFVLIGGGLLVFGALVVVLPLVVGWITALVGLPVRPFGVPAKLAIANARRNPGRVAATTTALMIGVALMTVFSVVLETVRVEGNAAVARNVPVDYLIFGTRGADGAQPTDVPTAVAATLRDRPEFAKVAQVRNAPATVDGDRLYVETVDPDGLGSLVRPDVVDGSLDDLGPGRISVSADKPPPALADVAVGDRITVTPPKGAPREYTVVARHDDGVFGGSLLMSWQDFTTVYGAGPDQAVLVKKADGVSTAAAAAALDALRHDFPLLEVNSMADRRAELEATLDQVLSVFAALLAMAVIIALFGIANTLSLSVFERTRESALVRALGLTRGQLRATLLIEALLIGLVGAAIGVAFGVTFGWAAATSMLADVGGGGLPSIPQAQLLLYVGVAALAGVLAGVLPARRAANSSVVAAMADT